MNLHRRVLPFLAAVAASASVGAVETRKRFFTTDAALLAALSVPVATSDGGTTDAVACCFVSRMSDPVGQKAEEPDGHEYAVTRMPVYEFELWRGFSDDDADPSEVAVSDAYERLAAAFDTASVRLSMKGTCDAVITEPLAMVEHTASMTPSGIMVSRLVARMTVEGSV